MRSIFATTESVQSLKFELPDINTWLVIILFSVLRFWLGLQITLGSDEAHYALYGMNLDWSYFDHPPLVGWVNAFFIFIFGVHDWVFRLPAICSGIVTALFVYNFSLHISRDSKVTHKVIWITQTALLPFALFLMFLPDTIMVPFALWSAWQVLKLLEEQSWINWFGLALSLGFSGLSKYTAVFLIVSILIIVLSEQKLKRFLTFKMLASAALALLLVLPVLYWNHLHEWISFKYQTDHVVGEVSYSFDSFFKSLAAQVIAYGPIWILFSLFVLSKIKLDRVSKVLLWFVLPQFLFFSYSGLKGFVLPHWTLFIYLIWFVVVFSNGFKSDKFKKTFWASLILSFSLILLVVLEFTFKFIPFENYKSAYTDLSGWHEVHDELKKIKESGKYSDFSIGVSNWSLGSRSVYYFSDVAPVFVLDQRFDQFDLWEKKQRKSDLFLLVKWHGFDFEKEITEMCEDSHLVSKLEIQQNNYITTSAELIACKTRKTE